MSKRQLEQRVKSAGLCVTTNGRLADAVLRVFVLKAAKHEFMHCAFQDGFRSNAVWIIVDRVLVEMQGHSKTAESLIRLLKSFQLPIVRHDG